MTGFWCESVEGVFGRSTWELRSVNHRYLDCNFRLPNGFLPLLPTLRKKLGEEFQRGKMEITLHFVPGEAHPNPFSINEVAVKWLMTLGQKLAKENAGTSKFSAMDILHWPGVLQETSSLPPEMHPAVLKMFEKALVQLKASREAEGQALHICLMQYLLQMEESWGSLKALIPLSKDKLKERLMRQVGDVKASIDPSRLEQEVILALQKGDVTEETERFEIHLAEVRKVLVGGGVVGKRLDFLMQELSREINTLSAKALCAEIGHCALDLKVVIEKMREQIQNVE
ncbi:MAG: YicC family protein [Gammaproteobacteria bacterium]|nr:YicC family protein [Gammaproteobacteria bacterium]